MESVPGAGLWLSEPRVAEVCPVWADVLLFDVLQAHSCHSLPQGEAGLAALVAISLDLRWLWEPGALVSPL